MPRDTLPTRPYFRSTTAEIAQMVPGADTATLRVIMGELAMRERPAAVALLASVRTMLKAASAVPSKPAPVAYAYLPKRKPAPAGKAWSLVTWIVRNGGLRDDRGDVLAIMGSFTARPGLINRKGMTLDRAAEGAIEAGYFPQHWDAANRGNVLSTMTPGILLDAIDEELRGHRLYVGGERDPSPIACPF